MKLNIAALGLIAFSSLVGAQTQTAPGANLQISLQNAQVVAAGKDLNMFRIPVKDITTGATTFFDAAFEFGVMDDGSVGFKRITTASISESSLRQGDNFVTGTYTDASGNRYGLTSTFGASGRLQYHLRALDAGKTFSASWFTGPIAGNPQGISTDCREGAVGAYGQGGGASFSLPVLGNLSGNYRLGFTQTSGTTLTLNSTSSQTGTCNIGSGLVLNLAS